MRYGCKLAGVLFTFALCLTAARASAQIVNGNFETGDMTGWTIDPSAGDAFDGNPFTGDAIIGPAPEGSYYLSSRISGDETKTGKVRSDTFKMTAPFIRFRMDGWRSQTGENSWNYVTLNLASDGTEISRVWAPNGTQLWATELLDGRGHLNENVYIEVVDDSTGGGFCWMSVDDFQFWTPTETAGLTIRNGDFESGDLTGWTTTGTAFNGSPKIPQAPWFPSNFKGNFFAASLGADGSAVGTLKSDPFVLQGTDVKVSIDGYSSLDGGPPNAFNYVSVKLASDNTEIGRAYALNTTNGPKPVTIDISSHRGEQAYVEVVDDSTDAARGWIAVDEVQLIDKSGAVINPITNGDFELGNMTGWTIENDGGTAFNDTATASNPMAAGSFWPAGSFQGDFFLNSRISGDETTVGKVRSNTFKMTKPYLHFLIDGWSSAPPFDPLHQYNYVTLNLASNNQEVGRAWAPNATGAFPKAVIDGSAALNQDVYIEVVDDGTGTGFAWLAVDNFHMSVYAAETVPLNGDFEEGDLTGWKATGAAFTGQPTQNLSNGTFSGINNLWYANTYYAGEASTGTLRSDVFTMNKPELDFLIAGYTSAPPFAENPTHNYVALKLASDDSEVGRAYAPNQNGMAPAHIDAISALGKKVYIEVVDNDSEASYAWMAVDNFQQMTKPATVTNPSFEYDPNPPYPGVATSGVTGWTITSGCGFQTSDAYTQGLTYFDNGLCPDGEKVAFIQGNGMYSQTIDGFVEGQVYNVSVWVNQRTGNDSPAQFQCKLGSLTLFNSDPPLNISAVEANGSFTQPFYHYQQEITAPATGSMTFSIANVNPVGDNTLLFDNATITPHVNASKYWSVYQ